MDPRACVRELLVCMEAGNSDRVTERCEALTEWMNQGGFPPVIIGPETLGRSWHVSIAQAVMRLATSHLQSTSTENR